MADIGSGIRAYLLGMSDITDLVGQRIYTDQLPQSATQPSVVMNVLFTTHEHMLSDLARLAHTRLQFECYAATRLVANEICDAIRHSGIVAVKGVTNSIDIRGVRVEEGMSFKNDAATDGSDELRYVSVIDLVIDHTEG